MTTISISILNIVVCAAILVGSIYAIYRSIKQLHTAIKIKDPSGNIIGLKKRSVILTVFLCAFLFAIIIFSGFMLVIHVFNIILIS